MKKIIVSMIAALLISSGANAQQQQTVFGEVIKVTPIDRAIKKQVPYESCRVVDVPIYGPTHSGPNIGGAIIGGVIGNQFGSGSGKEAMTALGALVGSTAGQRSDQIVGYRQERICTTDYSYVTEYINDGYRVTYTYDGKEYVIKTVQRYDVGDYIRLKINLTPIH